MAKPWDSYTLISWNLKLMSELESRQKLGNYDNTGKYAVQRSNRERTRDDSIVRLEPDLKRFFQRAIYAAYCDRLGSFAPNAALQSLIKLTAEKGFAELRATYRSETTDRGWFHRAFNQKTDQVEAVKRLVAFIQSETMRIPSWIEDTAKGACEEVRRKYKAGYKSTNKFYVEKVGGKYEPGRVSASGSHRPVPLTFAERNQLWENAKKELDPQRIQREVEEVRELLTDEQLAKRLSKLSDEVNEIVAREFGVGKTFNTITLDQKKAVKAKDKQFTEKIEMISVLKAARNLAANHRPLDRWQDKVGNCDELAVLARMKLEQNPFVCVCRLSTGVDQVVFDHQNRARQGDHVFTIFGLRLSVDTSFTRLRPPSPPIFITKRNRAALDRAWVVDPWANLCCRIDQYPSRFRDKMFHWSQQGKRIVIGSGKAIDPGLPAEDWYYRTVEELDWEVLEYRSWDVATQ
jgi:hypothetical protein